MLGLGAWVSRADTTLVNANDVWRYRKGVSAPAANWKTALDSALDSTWLNGKGGFGYADNTTETSLCGTLLSDMKGKYSTVAMRKSFSISSTPSDVSHLILTVDMDDGFIAWLDGVFLASRNAPNSPAEPSYNDVATASHESSLGDSSKEDPVSYDLGLVGNRLAIGTHVLSVVGLNHDLSSSSDFVQVISLSLTTNRQDCVSGLIASDTVWSVADSPIVVCGNVQIASGATLKIDPGVTVQLDNGVGIEVLNGGRLMAEGTAEAPLQFTHLKANGFWGHILIHGEPNSPESRIAHAHFEANADSVGTACIEVAAGTAFLDHLTFGNTRAPYIHVDGASFVIQDCVFPSATDRFELVHGTEGVKAGGHGIFLRNFFGSPIGYNDVVDFTGGNRPGPIVHFIGNVLSGGQDDGLDLDGTDAWVEGNVFMHIHRNGDTPDSSAAVSGGNDSGNVSDITVIGNIFYDCDNAATAKQGNFFSFINNTVVHTTREGGIDGDSGVVNVRDTTPKLTTFGKGYYLEGNVIVDSPKLVRNYDAAQTTVTWNRNLIPEPWNGPGVSNVVADPLLKHIPVLSETKFTTYQEAQVMWDWFSLQPRSPAIGSGPNGIDMGAVVARGASISGEPSGVTSDTSAELQVGFHRTGFGIPTAGWPDGLGYPRYRWRLDGGAWSPVVAIGVPIRLQELTDGPHFVEVSGQQDSGLFQDDPLFGEESKVTRSKTWVVQTAPVLEAIGITAEREIQFSFSGLPNKGYVVEYRDAIAEGDWKVLRVLDPVPFEHRIDFRDLISNEATARFYRVR